jgi:hypothetical protein
VNEFFDHLYTPLGTTSNYRAIVVLHTSQIITAPAKFFQPAVSLAVPWQRLLTVEIPQLHALRFFLHGLPCRPAYQLNYSAISSQPPLQSLTLK